jgi:hypothetical protein
MKAPKEKLSDDGCGVSHWVISSKVSFLSSDGREYHPHLGGVFRVFPVSQSFECCPVSGAAVWKSLTEDLKECQAIGTGGFWRAKPLPET